MCRAFGVHFFGPPCTLTPNTHRRRRRDSTRQLTELSGVGVGSVYCALAMTYQTYKVSKYASKKISKGTS